MRFCPFCAKETSDDAGRCVHCGRRLPARTAQNAQVPGPAAAALKPTMLGLGPDAQATPEGGAGPTTIGGPAGLADFPEPSAVGPLPVERILEGAAVSGPLAVLSRTRGPKESGGLDEETKLPPPAPGLVAPSRPPRTEDVPTRPGALPAREVRPRGQAPVSRMPPSIRGGPAGRASPAPPTPLLTPAGVPAAPLRGGVSGESPDPSEMTTPMARMDGSPLHAGPPLAVSSQSNIPALPPPPAAQAAPPAALPPAPAEAPVITSPLPRVPPPIPSATTPVPPAPSASSTPPAPAPVPTLELPPIPAAPASSGVLSLVAYLWPVSMGVWARRREQARMRRSLVAVQQSLDGLLLQLGRAAFEEGLNTAPTAGEMALLRHAEERRQHGLQRSAQLLGLRSGEEQKRAAAETEQQQAIAALTRQAEQLDAELRQRADQRRQRVAELSGIDNQLRRLSRAAEEADARAARGGDPHQAAQARAQGDSARGQAEALAPQREVAAREARALEEPLAELTQKLGAVRSDLGLRRQELLRHGEETTKLLAGLDADIKLAQAEREAAESEMQQRMMTIGTLVNLNRAPGARFDPLYRQVDEIKAQLAAYEATLARLDAESISYDRQAVQKGLLVLAAGGVALGLVVAVVYLIYALHTGGR